MIIPLIILTTLKYEKRLMQPSEITTFTSVKCLLLLRATNEKGSFTPC